MPLNLKEHFVIGVSSRALFDLSAESEIFEKQGLQAYTEYQIAHERDILKPGTGFQLVKALVDLNDRAKLSKKVIVIMMSKNNGEASTRISHSIEHYGLDIGRGAYTSGEPLAKYLAAFGVDLFLSASKSGVQAASDAGFAAGLVYPYEQDPSVPTDGLRIAFDGDAVLFSNESQRLYDEHGLEHFLAHEKKQATTPLADGPFAALIRKLAELQQQSGPSQKPLIRTALVTARNAPADERVIRTLRKWGVRIDEMFFLGGLPKAPILKAFAPHIFFDDQEAHCTPASQVVPTAQVLVSSHAQDPAVRAEGLPTKKPAASVAAMVIAFPADFTDTEVTGT